MTYEEVLEKAREGLKHLHDLWVSSELRYWEPFLDGYYTERVGSGPDAPTRRQLLRGEVEAPSPAEPVASGSWSRWEELARALGPADSEIEGA